MMHGFEMMHGYGTGSGIGIIGIIFMLLQLALWVGLIYLIFIAIKKLTLKESPNNNGDNSLNILRERYANGEIGQEEFKKMKENLMD